MSKNRIKDILDSLRIIFLILIIVVLKFIDNIVICLIPIILFIILSIYERIFWRCQKCGEYLPKKSFFNKVICCPYCNAKIDKN